MYTQILTVMPSDTACTNEIKIKSLLNYFQDVAGLAVADIEGSPGLLMQRGYAWVLLQYDIDVIRHLPGMDERFQVRTRHTTEDGFRTLRVFEVDSLSGEPLVRAKTSWVLIDLAAGRPVRARQHLPEIFMGGCLPIDPEFKNIPKFESSPEDTIYERSFSVRFHDLDANGHVNNAVYFEWAYEATPLNLLEYGVREICTEFRVSAKFGDVVSVKIKELGMWDSDSSHPSSEPGDSEPGDLKVRRFVYSMSNGKNPTGKPLARFCSVWVPLNSALPSAPAQ